MILIVKLFCFMKLMTKSHLIFQGAQVSLNTIKPSLQNHDSGKVLLVGDLFNTEQKAWFLCDPQLKNDLRRGNSQLSQRKYIFKITLKSEIILELQKWNEESILQLWMKLCAEWFSLDFTTVSTLFHCNSLIGINTCLIAQVIAEVHIIYLGFMNISMEVL